MRSPGRADLSCRVSATGSERATWRPGDRVQVPQSGRLRNPHTELVPLFHGRATKTSSSIHRQVAVGLRPHPQRQSFPIAEYRGPASALTIRIELSSSTSLCAQAGGPRRPAARGDRPRGQMSWRPAVLEPVWRSGPRRSGVARFAAPPCRRLPQRRPGSEGESVASRLSCHFLHSDFEPRFVLRRQR
jgi:hypothetical protein